MEHVGQLIAKKRDIKYAAVQQLLTGQKRLEGFVSKWPARTFGDVFDFYSTANNPRSDFSESGDIYYIHYGDIHTRFHNHLDFQSTRVPKIERQRCPGATLLKNGDWIMADASEDFAGVGKSIEISGLTANTAAVAGLHTFLLRDKTSTFAPGFKGHLGSTKSLRDQFLQVATGLKVYGVSKTALKRICLFVPDIAEQTAIVAVLSDMDAEIAALEARRDKTRLLKQGMMQELLTSRIRLTPSGAVAQTDTRTDHDAPP